MKELRKICENVATNRGIAIELILQKTCDTIDNRTILKITDEDRDTVKKAVEAIQIDNDFIIKEDKKLEAVAYIKTIIEKYKKMANAFAKEDMQKKKERESIVDDVYTFFDKNAKVINELSKEFAIIQKRMDVVGMSRLDLNLTLDREKLRSSAVFKKVGAYGLLVSYFNAVTPGKL